MLPSYWAGRDNSEAVLPVTAVPMNAYAHDAAWAAALNMPYPSVSPTQRHPRGSTGHRSGAAMRVSKPTSANNSPRSALLQSRRRTMMADGLPSTFRNRLLDLAYLPTPATEAPSASLQPQVRRSARPVSWHPSTQAVPQLQQPQMQALNQYPFPPSADSLSAYPLLSPFPSTPATYSEYASPSSTFSPLPYAGLAAPPLWSNGSNSEQAAAPYTAKSQLEPEVPQDASSTYLSFPSPPTSSNWDTFADGPYLPSSSPPTPDNLLPSRPAETKIPAEEVLPFPPLEDDESEGEILYGMGLYDPPDRLELDTYTAPVSALFGSTSGRPGKGLKLEDAWEPPSPREDEEGGTDAEDDQAEDGEGEDE